MTKSPVIWWLRRDLRLADNPALTAALALAQTTGGGVVPLYIHDPQDRDLGAAPKFRLGLGLEKINETLNACGSKLIIREGPALEVLRAVSAELGAKAVVWSREYDPRAIARDTEVKAELKALGIEAKSTGGRLLFEPWTVATGAGGMFKVYTLFWKAVRGREPGGLVPAPTALPQPDTWPQSLPLAQLQLGRAMNRGAAVVAQHCTVGEDMALARLDRFLSARVERYKDDRDRPALEACSGLSENLAWGEISPHRIWAAGQVALAQGAAGAEHFLKELCWREFAYHLMYHSPEILTRNWRPDWDRFAWREEGGAELLAWQQGRSGYALVDAAMRELYVTGRMHNRARMIVASFLCKHLMISWKLGMNWFEDCLVDWDPASNAMGWQWVAGSGPDAAPFFRIFNPDTQAKTHDPDGEYVRRWLGDGTGSEAFSKAVPRSWGGRVGQPPTSPIVGLKEGREAALAAYAALRTQVAS